MPNGYSVPLLIVNGPPFELDSPSLLRASAI
jgi:hypothetical protein